jgi:hypothetical protein
MTIFTIVMIGSVMALICVVASSSLLNSVIHGQRKEVARFKMYALRGELVQLVADEKMEEDNEAWQLMYCTINALLAEARDAAPWKVLRSHLKVAKKLRSDSNFSAAVDAKMLMLRHASREVPEFGSICDRLAEADEAILYSHISFVDVVVVAATIAWIFVRYRALSPQTGTRTLIGQSNLAAV